MLIDSTLENYEIKLIENITNFLQTRITNETHILTLIYNNINILLYNVYQLFYSTLSYIKF